MANPHTPNPSGFYFAPPTENVVHCFEYNKNTEPEIKFNDYVYFYSPRGLPTLHVVESDILRKIVAKPTEEQHRMDKLMMMDEFGVILPAHLPNIADVVGKPEVQAVIRELKNDATVEYEGKTKIIPKRLVNLIDPKPVVPQSGPIYSLRMGGFTTEFGSYTDEFVFLRVKDKMSALNFTLTQDQFIEHEPTSRYQAITLRPELENDKKTLNLGASVILWSGRRITRPSFVPHFQQVVGTHNPIFMIVAEIGATSFNTQRILRNLGTAMKWRFDAGKGIMGGSILFWDPSRVNATVMVADSQTIELRMLGSINANEE